MTGGVYELELELKLAVKSANSDTNAGGRVERGPFISVS